MAEAKPKGSKKQGNKILLYSALGVGGVVVLYLAYRYYENNVAGSGGTGTSSGVPADTTPTPSTPTSTPSLYGTATTLAQWKAMVLQYMTSNGIPGGENVAAIGLTDALSGHCVGPNEFAALNGALAAIGQPPGSNTLVLKQCSQGPNGQGTGTSSHGSSPASTGATSSTHGGGGPGEAATRRGTAASRQRTNAIAANARRRANALAANARRRANEARAAANRRARNVSRPGTGRLPFVH